MNGPDPNYNTEHNYQGGVKLTDIVNPSFKEARKLERQERLGRLHEARELLGEMSKEAAFSACDPHLGYAWASVRFAIERYSEWMETHK